SRDGDGFNRWDASQQLALQVLQDFMAAYQRDELHSCSADARLLDAYRSLLLDTSLDQAMVAYMLTLPTEAYISELAEQIDVEAIHYSRIALRKCIARELRREFETIYFAYDH